MSGSAKFAKLLKVPASYFYLAVATPWQSRILRLASTILPMICLPRFALSAQCFCTEGKPVPTELRKEERQLRHQIELEDDNTAVPRTHVDDEYAHAGERDPKILITTSRDPSSRLTQFAKELKLIFPGAQRLNRGGQVSCCLASRATFCSSEVCLALSCVGYQATSNNLATAK